VNGIMKFMDILRIRAFMGLAEVLYLCTLILKTYSHHIFIHLNTKLETQIVVKIRKEDKEGYLFQWP